MDTNFWITIVGAIITIVGAIASIVGMIVSIRNAKSAMLSSNEAVAAMRIVDSTTVTENLKSAQNLIRGFSPEKREERGFNPERVLDELRQVFDKILGFLSMEGPEGDVRSLIESAQKSLNEYSSLPVGDNKDNKEIRKKCVKEWGKLQLLIQDAMSTHRENAVNIGE